ncbi:MAG TPA: bifunctional RNase H/acid phosphatase [Mycobacteriales bacterium]|nr:bifunctional RNase H/acid phosphatase [Mycobacteriales bacterium]
MGRRVVVEADGGSRGNPGPAGYGAVVRDADSGEVLAEVAAGIGRASNNVAEYRGLLAGLTAAIGLGDVDDVEVRMDSKLVVEQMAGRWQVKHPDMRTLRREAAELVARLPRVTFTHVPRARNAHADRLANEAMDAAARGETWERGPRGAAPAAVEAPAARPTGWQLARGEPTSLLLLRHGQTAMSVERRFSGSGDPPLTQVGRAQAAALAGRVAAMPGPFAAVVSSPLARARQTAEPVAAALGLDVVVDERLRETDFGAWEGLTFGEIRERDPEGLQDWLDDPAVPAPGGESFAQVGRRVRQARDALLAEHGGASVVVVTHVTPVKLLLSLALDAPTVLYRVNLDLASISQAEWYPDGNAVVRRVNDTAHLEGLDEAALHV